MFGFLTNAINKRKQKKQFREFGYKVVHFQLEKEGAVQYAQWLHPGEFGNVVSQANVDFYRQFVKEGDFVIDIGANEGDTTVPLALAVGKAGITLGLEPNPHAYKVLEVNSKLNSGKTTIVPLNFAATSHDGEFTFGSGDASYGNGGIVGFTHNKPRNVRYTFKVEGRNIENYLYKTYPDQIKKLSLIKVDAEGYDKEILKTLRTLIAAQRPVLITECFGPSTSEEKLELFDILTEMNYSLFWLTDFVPQITPPISRMEMKGKETINILAKPL